MEFFAQNFLLVININIQVERNCSKEIVRPKIFISIIRISRKIYILDKDLRTKLFMQYSLTFYENLQIC